jgi:hypothetical protein
MRSRIGAHQALFDKIKYIHGLTRALPINTDSDYFVAELCKYCCILASAAIDVCMEDCLFEYCDRANDQRIANYIKEQLARARNPTVGTVCSVMGFFDVDWKYRLEQFSDQKIRSDIGSIVSNRNEIAHGRNSQISFGRLLPWVTSAVAFCREIERTVFP